VWRARIILTRTVYEQSFLTVKVLVTEPVEYQDTTHDGATAAAFDVAADAGGDPAIPTSPMVAIPTANARAG
jgi:hypothetical protein